uniref:DUF4604 domain-containing protein n=1 Tax=Strongyloides papillosus TaxID=174720 RepID=A0A0N5CDX7_STREA
MEDDKYLLEYTAEELAKKTQQKNQLPLSKKDQPTEVSQTVERGNNLDGDNFFDDGKKEDAKKLPKDENGKQLPKDEGENVEKPSKRQPKMLPFKDLV